MRLWPKSLLGQMLLAVALALLVAQGISATLLWRAGEKRSEQAALNAAAFRLLTTPRNHSDNEGRRDRREDRQNDRQNDRQGSDRQNIPHHPARALRIEFTQNSPLLPAERLEPELEEQLREILTERGVIGADLIVLKRKALDDDFIRSRPRLIQRLKQDGASMPDLLVVGLRLPGEQQWRIARAPFPQPHSGTLQTIILQTLLIYILLVGLHFLLLRRITRPLATLTRRTENFGQNIGARSPLLAEGPEDISRLIAAHNAMEARIAALLDEKDVMLGAIGHDLKTPLAALRVRIESVEDQAERSKMAHSIEDITRSLDDILSLARIGRAVAPPEKAQLAALVLSVIEEFEDMGEAVETADIERITYPVHVTWLKRALRNLISNAVRYGGGAEISLGQSDGHVILRVDDNGPGIPQDKIAGMMEPFIRGETSRNRDTGGSGLGLTLARAIAEQHGGTLTLTNHETGGLRAEIRLPRLT